MRTEAEVVEAALPLERPNDDLIASRGERGGRDHLGAVGKVTDVGDVPQADLPVDRAADEEHLVQRVELH
eukprot:CAMPEP_0177623498 /NCGR_PEP_ID=MMETSP0419_2-20121207/28935_1 /TAXON_ID=582737 /ORGANISM="Tetraselmis sp., Strain GSL018" /LENGTH=69 /DNA_ID=CAMNT_0019124055 /DNA_START=490 /DNA_END=697 /DNA_ORIENTATION=+